jgi:hypothetical protein
MIFFDEIIFHASNHDETIVELNFNEPIYFIIIPIGFDLYIVFEQNAVAILQKISDMSYVFILVYFLGIGDLGLDWL